MFYKIILTLILLASMVSGIANDTINLKGNWHYRLLGAPSAIPGEGFINLPGTLDQQHKSIYNPEGNNTNQLRREFSFIGEATYSKKIEIPESWKEKHIELKLERTKPSSVYIDGIKIASNSRISSSQYYNLSTTLSPGFHLLEIVVNNADSIPPITARSSNAVSESTQTNWNGILGEISLIARHQFHIKSVTVRDLLKVGKVEFNIKFSSPAPTGFSISMHSGNGEVIKKSIPSGATVIKLEIPISENDNWSPTHPEIHNFSFFLKDRKGNEIDTYNITTGYRDFNTQGNYFTINDKPIFLRGTVNAAVFPLTGYAPIDKQSWLNYFQILKDYGLNHVRFHSWTPPKAAFEAADELGFLLLIELPIWGELDRDLKFHDKFLREDMNGIMEEYAIHPSFTMFSPGNELWGDISLMGEYMNKAKQLNPRILATHGTNVYLGMNGALPGDDFIVSSKTSDDIKNSVRGSSSYADTSDGGFFNSSYPNSTFNFGEATENIQIPVIAHEVGQYQTYPDFTEIKKYTGNLKPDNLKEFLKRAEEAGTIRKNKEYHEASGEWAAKLYKAEMELALRSPGIAGFQLFGMQDYPGQGTALVGILDPFMDSKGFTTPEEFRQSASDIVILAEFPKYSFTEGEIVEIPIVTANFTDNPDTIPSIKWATEFGEGKINILQGNGIMENGSINLKMPNLKNPRKYSLRLSTENSGSTNHYDFWVYPKNISSSSDVLLTKNLTEALVLLEQGERVILCPDSSTVSNASIGALFIPDFWNYRMYRTICDEMHLTPSPGTLGLLIDDSHPAFNFFPTDNHSDWQWYPIVANSRPLIIDRLPKDFDPVVEVIDNTERNFRLSLLLECNVGKGKLMILSSDIEKAIEYPEGKWFLESLKAYMAGKDFKPKFTLTPEQLVNLLTKPSNSRLIKELKNETYNSSWD